jgi:hypothetical protein
MARRTNKKYLIGNLSCSIIGRYPGTRLSADFSHGHICRLTNRNSPTSSELINTIVSHF